MADYMRTNEYTLAQFQHAIDGFVAAGETARSWRRSSG